MFELFRKKQPSQVQSATFTHSFDAVTKALFFHLEIEATLLKERLERHKRSAKIQLVDGDVLNDNIKKSCENILGMLHPSYLDHLMNTFYTETGLTRFILTYLTRSVFNEVIDINTLYIENNMERSSEELVKAKK